MKITIEFETDNAAFEDNILVEMKNILAQALAKAYAQMHRKGGCVCTAPEAVDRLFDINGNTVGKVVVDR